MVSLDSKAHQAGREMVERQEILELRVQVDNQDLRVQLDSLEIQVSMVVLDGLVHQDLKDRLDSLALKVVECSCFDIVTFWLDQKIMQVKLQHLFQIQTFLSAHIPATYFQFEPFRSFMMTNRWHIEK